jgi:hypothetical protein
MLMLDTLGLVPNDPFDDFATGTISLSSDGFFAKIREGHLVVVRDTVIDRLAAVMASP